MPDDAKEIRSLSACGLTKSFGGLRAVRDLSVEVSTAEILGLIGPNGSGKTTFVNLVTGFEVPSAGSIAFNGRCLNGLRPHQIARLGVARTFQIQGFFPNLTVEQNLAVASHLEATSTVIGAVLRTKSYVKAEERLRDRVASLIGIVHLEHRGGKPAAHLASGEQARLKIGIALATRPHMLLLDEPAAGMNMAESESLIGLIRALHSSGLGIVLIEHNMKLVMSICTRIVVINFGVKLAEGSPAEIARDPAVVAAYLGRRTGVAT